MLHAMRVYIPTTLATLAEAYKAGELGPAPLDAFAKAHIPPDKRLDVRKTQASLRYRARIRRERLPELERALRER